MVVKVILFIIVFFISFSAADYTYAETVWSQEFNGSKIDNDVWTYDVGNSGFGNGELQYYTARSENVYLDNGKLVIQALRENYKGSGNAFTSARLKTHGRFAFKYGTLKARIKVPDLADGLWPAFWLLGTNIGQTDWPACGELDILEMGMSDAIAEGLTNNRLHAGAFWDYQGSNANYGEEIDSPIDLNNDYHIYKLVWTPSSLTVYLDDTPYWTMDISEIEESSLEEFHKPMYIITNLAVGGWNFVEISDPAQITAPFPAKMFIDWIRLEGNADTELYYGEDNAESGNFGVYTETTPVDAQLTYGTDAEIYLWNNMSSVSDTPYEGSEVMSFDTAGGDWFGMGIFCLENKNMGNYSDGYLHLRMKTTTSAPFRIGIASSAGGESWLSFVDGEEQFGLTRDGNWHEMMIPLNRYSNVDFKTINQIFMIAGDPPGSSLNISIDDIYWIPSVQRPTPVNGNFGVFTETASHKDAGEYQIGVDGEFYIWEDTLSAAAQNPYEGAASMSLQSNPGLNWFGMAFTPNIKYNLSAFRYPESKLHFALKTDSDTTFMVGIKSGNVEDIGQKWITFESGNDPYGFSRDGNWHIVEIPMSDIAEDVDLSQVSQLFEILGVDGPVSNIEIDDICFTGGGSPVTGGNIAPSISITSPSNGQYFSVGDDIIITADACDSDGTVNKVEFFEGTNLLYEDTTAPYEFTWNDVTGGAYTLTAKAVDSNDSSGSSSVKVYVGEPVLSGINISPSSVTVEVGQTQQFTAAGYDQFNLPYPVNESWSVTHGGSIDSNGVFAATMPGSDFDVTAYAGAFSASAEVDIVKPTGVCTGGPANGEYTYEFSGDSENPTITFVPGYEGVGDSTLIIYHSTSEYGTFPGNSISPNVPYQVTASEGDTIYFYYTYSIPEGGEHNTAADMHSVTVGSCGGSVSGDINGDGSVDFYDINMLAYYWLDDTCSDENDFCYGADTESDGTVNFLDMADITRCWLE